MNNKLIRGGGDSENINMLRFPLAILVVFVHSFGADIDVSQLHASGLTGEALYNYVRIFFSVVIARSAVPIFFIISGYLLFLKVEDYGKKVYIGKLKKRWHSLVIPYFAWNVLFVLYILMLKLGGIILHGKPISGIGDYFLNNGYLHMLWDSSVWGERTTWLGVVTHHSGPALLPFWYMRDLIMMVILSPVIYWLIKKLKIFFILIMLAIYAFDIRVSWMSGTFTIAGLFFSLGAYWAIMKQEFTDVLWKWRYVICPSAAILMCWQTYTGSAMGDSFSRMVHPWLVVALSFAMIIAASAMCRKQKLYSLNKRLAGTSFFIYAFHPFILGRVREIVAKMMPTEDMWYMQILEYLISPLLCVAICVGIYLGMKKYLPSVTRVLMGGGKTKVIRCKNQKNC